MDRDETMTYSSDPKLVNVSGVIEITCSAEKGLVRLRFERNLGESDPHRPSLVLTGQRGEWQEKYLLSRGLTQLRADIDQILKELGE